MRRLLLSTVALLGVIGASVAANIPLITGPVDPANEIATLNQLIQSVIFGTNGLLGSLATPAVSSGTSKIALFNVTLPGGQMSAVGQIIHMKAVGVNSADANVKTLTFDFGSIACAVIVTGSAVNWQADFYVTKTGTNTQQYSCSGMEGTTLVTVAQGTGAVTDTAAIAADVSATAATAGTMTLNQAWAEQLK